MMRLFASVILALSVAACAPKGAYDNAVDDDRFDLLAYHMPDILSKDAKKCVTGSSLLRGQSGGQDVVAERIFETALDVWQVVDVTLLSKDNAPEVLPNGGDAASVESIFPKGINLPTVIANACGVYAGELAVNLGLVSLPDTIDAALKQDPEAFVKMGMSTEVVKSGVAQIGRQAAALGRLTVADRVQCSAIYEAASVSDNSLTAYTTIWRAALVDLIDTGALDPKNIREQSKFWQILAKSGPDAVLTADGYQEEATKCDGWVNEAINSAAEAE